MPTPAAAAATVAESRVRKGSDEHALDDIARSQLLYVLGVSAAGDTSKGEGWLGTRLFPNPGAEDSVVDDRRVDHHCGSTNVGQDSWRSSYGAGTCGSSRDNSRIAVNKKSRVRARPTSWSARPSGKRRGRFGIWSDGADGEDGSNDENCWGDGDGYLTLRPFPSIAESGAEDLSGGGVVAPVGDAESLRSNPASASRADRFLQVFSQLQPARRALNLDESPLLSPKEREGNRAEVDGASERVTPRVDACDARDSIARLGPKNQAETVHAGDSPIKRPVGDVGEGGTESGARARAPASRCDGGIVGEVNMPVPKRTVLRILRPPEASADNHLRLSIKTTPGCPSLGDAECENRRHASSPCSLEPASKRKFNRNRTAQQNQEEPRRHGEGGNRGTGGPAVPRSPATVVRPTSEVKDSPGVDCVTNDAIASRQDFPTVAMASVQDTSQGKASGLGRTTISRVPLASQSPTAMPIENRTTGKRRKSLALVDRARLKATVGEPPEPIPRQASLGSAGGIKSPLAAREECQGAPTANEGGNKLKGDPQLAKKLAAPFSTPWNGSRSRGVLACRASSGLLRSADLAAESEPQQAVSEGAKLAPSASHGLAEPSATDVSQQELCQGHEMDVFQNVGSVGATI